MAGVIRTTLRGTARITDIMIRGTTVRITDITIRGTVLIMDTVHITDTARTTLPITDRLPIRRTGQG